MRLRPLATCALLTVLTLQLSAPLSAAVGRTADDRSVVAVVLLDTPPLASYRGGIRGLAATAIDRTGAAKLDVHASAARAYLGFLAERLGGFETEVRAVIPDAAPIYRYAVVLGGVALRVHESDLGTLAALPGVTRVLRDEAFAPDTNLSPKFVGATKLWKKLGGASVAGEGIVVGMLDTGIWPEHPSLADPDPSGKPYPPPPATWNGGAGPFCQPPDDGSPPLVCNNKLIGARHFLAAHAANDGFSAGEFQSARDQDGHGTHTTTIAAGNGGVHAVILGVDRGVISGIAPRAHVATYRVCGLQSSGKSACFSSDTAAAVQQAIVDGVDVMNFSIGGGTDPYTQPAQLAFLDAYAAGVFISTSAGNDGPNLGTINNLQPWTATVANTTEKRVFTSEIELKGDVTGKLKLAGASTTGGIKGKIPLVAAAAFGDAFCASPFAPGMFTGFMVACQRGNTPRTTKSHNVLLGGGAGMVLYQTASFTGASRDLHFVPTIHLNNAESDLFIPFLASNGVIMAKFAGLEATKTKADVLAASSSRGGPSVTQGIMKPDLAAPGTEILAGASGVTLLDPEDNEGSLFQVLSGTSMASPHVAGAAALARQAHPDWTPGQIHSALMTTATIKKLFREDGATLAGPFDVGSGRLDVARVADPGVTFDATKQDFLDHQGDLWTVNYPSLYVPSMGATFSVDRTMVSQLAKTTKFKLSVQAPPDLGITVPPEIVLDPGASGTFTIALDATAVPSGEVRHAVLLIQGKAIARFPITIIKN